VTAIIVAIVLVVLCGFAALSLDVGHLFSVRGELQNGADAAALAGAKRLNGRNTNFELDAARGDAENYARNHLTDRWDVEPTTIQLGAWAPPGISCGKFGGTQAGATGPDGYKFCAIAGTTEADASNNNAVRVITRRVGTPGEAGGGAVELAFGSFVGHREPQAVGAEAIAVTGGPCGQACPKLPIVIRAGCIYDGDEIRCDDDGIGDVYMIGLSDANADTAGLTSLSTDPASANNICEIIERPPNCDMPLESGEPIETQEGTSWNSACTSGCSARTYNQGRGAEGATNHDSICEAIRMMADRDCDGAVDLDESGRPAHRVQVPVVQYADEAADYCEPGAHYNQQANVVGWATAAIVSVRCEAPGTSPNQLPFGAKPITGICDGFLQSGGKFSGDTCVAIQLFCNEEDDEPSADVCKWFGTGTLQPALVR
jgi:hypothetical protein